MVGVSINDPMPTCTNAPSRTTEKRNEPQDAHARAFRDRGEVQTFTVLDYLYRLPIRAGTSQAEAGGDTAPLPSTDRCQSRHRYPRTPYTLSHLPPLSIGWGRRDREGETPHGRTTVSRCGSPGAYVGLRTTTAAETSHLVLGRLPTQGEITPSQVDNRSMPCRGLGLRRAPPAAVGHFLRYACVLLRPARRRTERVARTKRTPFADADDRRRRRLRVHRRVVARIRVLLARKTGRGDRALPACAESRPRARSYRLCVDHQRSTCTRPLTDRRVQSCTRRV